MMARFKTDATAIHVDYGLYRDRLSLPHMPATGVSGVDLYARDAAGKWRWVKVTKPAAQVVKAEIIRGLAPGFRVAWAGLAGNRSNGGMHAIFEA